MFPRRHPPSHPSHPSRRRTSAGRKWPVSTDGGTQPIWSRNGKELFYRVSTKTVVVAVTTTATEMRIGPPTVLCQSQYALGLALATANYDVSADGQRLVMVKDELRANSLKVALNLFEELKATVPAK